MSPEAEAKGSIDFRPVRNLSLKRTSAGTLIVWLKFPTNLFSICVHSLVLDFKAIYLFFNYTVLISHNLFGTRESPYFPKKGEIRTFLGHFMAGIRFPLDHILVFILKYVDIPLCCYTPGSLGYMVGFLSLSYQVSILSGFVLLFPFCSRYKD